MKKTIEYAGIAAATLLAISPVATQVLTESGTVVKAETTATPSDAEKTAMDHLAASLKGTTYKTSEGNPFPSLLSSDKSSLDNPSFGSGMPNGYSAQGFINGPLFTKLKDTTLTDADKTALKNTNITVLNQVIGSDGKPIDLSDDKNSSGFMTALNTVRNVTDYGGTLNLRATIKYDGNVYNDIAPVDYSLTNSDMASADSGQVSSAIANFKSNLINDVSLSSGDKIASDLTNLNGVTVAYPGQRIFYGDENQSSIDYIKNNTRVISKALANMPDKVKDSFNKNNINIVVKVKDSSGKEVMDLKGLKEIDSNQEPFTANFSFQYPDGKGNMQSIEGSDVSFEPEKTSNSVDGTYDKDPIHVKDGSKVSNVDFGNLTLKAGDNSYTSEASASGGLYLTEADAWNSLTNSPAIGPEEIGDTFDASKKSEYYQVVSAPVPSDLSDFMQKWLDDSNWSDGNAVNYKLSINDQEIPINMDSDQIWVIPDAPIKVWASTNGIYYIREINVDKSDSNSNNNNNSNNSGNVQSISGVATTHNDNGFYFLYNDNNEKVDNRALGKNSSWKVDGARTINGVKQYRVSTHEWVNASDVDFDENDEITEGMSVQKLDTPKQINLETKHSRYGLHNSKLKLSTTRALAGGTSWIVDKVGTDSNGDTYYGVSTDEFVKAGDGVTLVK